MPAISNIVVKKFDGTTDITYTALAGATGDTPALFRANSVSTIPAHCPTFRISSKANPNGTTRIMKYEYDMPIVQDVAGVPTVVGHLIGNGNIPVLQNADWNQVREGVAQQLNLLASSLYKSSIMEGFAPR